MKTLRQLLNVTRLAVCASFALAALAAYADDLAQDAFYVYRNDGDFNGFFYDEVLKMEYSRFDLDSVEHSEFVVQDIVTADSTYRIPLAAIDSIGFQQPEIKFNPKVKFVERDGLSDYLMYTSRESPDKDFVMFYNLPEDKRPKIGDIIIGLPTDAIANRYGSAYGGGLGGGSFSCVVTEIRDVTEGYFQGETYVYGHPIENISDVFEQFITVEMIGFDEEGNEHRRIAGCTSDGMPRRRASGDSGNIELFNLSGDISRKWNPNPDTEIDLSATVGFKHTCRATYDISWSRFFVKLTRDLIITAKPTIGIASTHSFDENVGWLDIGLRKIKFPAAAPFFETDPFPDLFVRGSGLLEARFNLPAVRLGVGDDLIFDTNNLFPIWYTLHFTPDAADAVPDEMLDLSAQVKMEASLQFGVKFNATVSTNSWFKKILFAEVGLHLYTGPKIGGSVTLKADAEGISLYESLSNAIINYSLLSLDLEAKAKAAAFWNDPEEKTFFSKSLAFFCDTVRFAPSFDSIRVLEMTKNDVAIELYPNKSRLMTLPTLTMGVWDQKSGGTPIMKEGSWSMNPKKDIKYTISLPLSKFKAMHTYYVSPIVDLPGRGEFEVRSMVAEFTPPYTMELESDSLSFPGNGGTAEVNFTTNCPKENIKLLFGGKIQYQATTSLEVIDEEHGHYKAVFTANPNPSLFDISVPKDSVTLGISPEIVLGYDTQNMKRFFLGAYQAEFEFSDKIPVQFYAECDGRYKVQYEGAVTAERNGKNIIQFTGNQSDWFDCTSAGCYTEGDGVVQRCELEGAISRDPITGKITCSVAGTARQSVSETESRKAAEYTTSASASFDLQLGGMGFGSEWWGSNAGEIKSGYFTSQISGEGEYNFDWMNWIEGHSSSVIKPKFAVKLSIP